MNKGELIDKAKEIRDGLLIETGYNYDLEGFCAIFTVRFLNYVGNSKETRWCLNMFHCFPVVKGVVYDGTATQFSRRYPPVLVEKLKILEKKKDKFGLDKFWEVQKEGATVKELILTLNKVGWPKSQTPRYDGGLRAITRKHGPHAELF